MAHLHLSLLVLVYDFLDKNYSSSSTRGVSPVEAPVVNQCGIEAVILVLGTIFSFVGDNSCSCFCQRMAVGGSSLTVHKCSRFFSCYSGFIFVLVFVLVFGEPISTLYIEAFEGGFFGGARGN